MSDISSLNIKMPNLSWINDSLQETYRIQRESEFKKNNPADSIFSRIQEQVQEFESTLDNMHELWWILVWSSYDQFYITALKKSNPDMIIFYWETRDWPIQIIQHVSQIDISLISLKKQKDHEAPRRIWFITD